MRIAAGWRRHYRWLLVVIWAIGIWSMSMHSQPPGDPIGKITQAVQGTLLEPPVLPGRSVAFSVGKLGHIWEYCVLGSLLAWAVIGEGKLIWLAIPLGTAVSALDETIQRFTPGREGCLRDVLIDLLGISLGVLLLRLLRRIRMHRTRGERTPGRI